MVLGMYVVLSGNVIKRIKESVLDEVVVINFIFLI